LLEILGATQAAYGYLPVAALKRISFGTGAWYAMVFGTATYYDHLRFEPPSRLAGPDEPAAPPLGSGRKRLEADYLAGLDQAIGGGSKGPGGRVN